MLHCAKLGKFPSPTPSVVKRLGVDAKQRQRLLIGADGMSERHHLMHLLR